MRIVHVLLGKADPNTMNGVNKVVHHLATEHHRAGHDVEVWGLVRVGSTGTSHLHEYRLRLLPTSRGRLLLSRQVKAAIRALPRDGWVQFHSVFVPEFRAIADALLRRGIAYGVTPHGGYSSHAFSRGRLKKALYMRTVELALLKQSSLVHAIGASEVTDIRRWTRAPKVVLVPNGQVAIADGGSRPAGAGDSGPVFCFCGRLARQHKGLDLLIAGFVQYLKAGGRGSLWLIGDGADRVSLEGMASRSGGGTRIRFHGAQFGERKLGLMRSCDVFVHTSRWDVVPTAALEAAALGLPLLISKETNLGDAVEACSAGVVLQENSPKSIARAMASLEAAVSDGSDVKMGDNARAMVASRFAWPQIAHVLAGEYESARHHQRRAP